MLLIFSHFVQTTRMLCGSGWGEFVRCLSGFHKWRVWGNWSWGQIGRSSECWVRGEKGSFQNNGRWNWRSRPHVCCNQGRKFILYFIFINLLETHTTFFIYTGPNSRFTIGFYTRGAGRTYRLRISERTCVWNNCSQKDTIGRNESYDAIQVSYQNMDLDEKYTRS